MSKTRARCGQTPLAAAVKRAPARRGLETRPTTALARRELTVDAREVSGRKRQSHLVLAADRKENSPPLSRGVTVIAAILKKILTLTHNTANANLADTGWVTKRKTKP